MTDQLIFGVGRLLCALPLADVVETVRPLPVQPLAGGAGALLGVAVIRGAAVPVLDTGRVLGDPGVPPTRFVTASTQRGPVAFATGDVVGVRSIAPSTAGPPPAAGTLVSAVGVLDGRPLLFLYPEAALDAAALHNGVTDQAVRHNVAREEAVPHGAVTDQTVQHSAARDQAVPHSPASGFGAERASGSETDAGRAGLVGREVEGGLATGLGSGHDIMPGGGAEPESASEFGTKSASEFGVESFSTPEGGVESFSAAGFGMEAGSASEFGVESFSTPEGGVESFSAARFGMEAGSASEFGVESFPAPESGTEPFSAAAFGAESFSVPEVGVEVDAGSGRDGGPSAESGGAGGGGGRGGA
jgi:purine-binding chemotaxis protein CheW